MKSPGCGMIPKLLHFCFGLAPDFGGKPWSLFHYACVRSAVERIQPDQAFFCLEFEPKGPWWDLTKDLVTIVRIEAPGGRPFSRPAPDSPVALATSAKRAG